MTMTVLKRQFITDAAGNLIGIILALKKFALVEEILGLQVAPSLTLLYNELAVRKGTKMPHEHE